jgi:hypothetical protein
VEFVLHGERRILKSLENEERLAQGNKNLSGIPGIIIIIIITITTTSVRR